MYSVIKGLLFLVFIMGSILSWKLFSFPRKTKFIAFYTLSITLIACNQMLSYYSSNIEIFPIFNTFIGYFLSPLLFFQCISLFKINDFKKLFYRHILVSIPFLCIIIYWIFDDYRRKLLGYGNNSYITILLVVQYFVYLLLLILFLGKRKGLMRGIKPTLQFKRIRLTVILFLIQALITIAMLFENFTSYEGLTEYLVFFIFLLFMGQLVLIFYNHNKYLNFFTGNDEPIHFTNEGYDKVGWVKSESSKEVLLELQKLMSEQKLFKDSSLNLKRLADELHMAEHTLSKILKDSYNLTYSQYISFQRLEEAKKLLIQSRDNGARINEIMFEVGFNSKSAFNTWFKKRTGFTPTEFKKGSE
ncbi:AraC family transcriptional regulator [Flagellimonas aequoris]|uniref:AraC family transcriptional regulator n=1 Tax=Flagellimonas aequoris TaxID=2306997 RepID=A0A418N8K7_9FLAO|nr:AraC family transcriptional regulator [Allomuricauda aequoris]TXK03718.1 helix-turn-helix transcriptional regulator [Allomuricauda aequoris]